MGYILDSIIKKSMKGSYNPDGSIDYETINASGYTDSVVIDGVEESFMVAITYANGVSVDIDFNLEVSIDGVSYVPYDSDIKIIDNSGEILYDIAGSAGGSVRVSYVVNSGSLDVYVRLSGKRRH
jgi:hypothetical protein